MAEINAAYDLLRAGGLAPPRARSRSPPAPTPARGAWLPGAVRRAPRSRAARGCSPPGERLARHSRRPPGRARRRCSRRPTGGCCWLLDDAVAAASSTLRSRDRGGRSTAPPAASSRGDARAPRPQRAAGSRSASCARRPRPREPPDRCPTAPTGATREQRHARHRPPARVVGRRDRWPGRGSRSSTATPNTAPSCGASSALIPLPIPSWAGPRSRTLDRRRSSRSRAGRRRPSAIVAGSHPPRTRAPARPASPATRPPPR